MKTQKGFANILLIIVGVLVTGGGIYYYNNNETLDQEQFEQEQDDEIFTTENSVNNNETNVTQNEVEDMEVELVVQKNDTIITEQMIKNGEIDGQNFEDLASDIDLESNFSDSNFIELVYPNGGEEIEYSTIFMAGDLYFRWKSSIPSYRPTDRGFAILLDEDDNELRNTGLTYYWENEDLFSYSFSGTKNIEVDTKYRVRVCDYLNDKLVCDESERYFTVVGAGNDKDGQISDNEENATLCTADAKQCPDGSWVGRTGSNCEFVCPEQNSKTENHKYELGLIKDLYFKDNHYYMDVDYITKTNIQNDPDCNAPNGVCFNNQNPKIRTFQIAENPVINMQCIMKYFGNDQTIDMTNFIGLYSGEIINPDTEEYYDTTEHPFVNKEDGSVYNNYLNTTNYQFKIENGMITEFGCLYHP